MKVLIGAASVSVIALTAYVIGGDYLRGREETRQQFAMSCSSNLERAKATDPSSISSAERKRISKGLFDCSTFFRTGEMP